MNKYFKILGLKSNASLEEVTKKYNELSKEFDPENQDEGLKEFFINEKKKLDEAFEKVSLFIKKANIISDSSINEDVTEELSTDNKANDDNKKETVSDFADRSTISDNVSDENIIKKRSKQLIFNNVLLLIIAFGIWGLFMQNMGLFVPNDDYTQKVRVVNTVETEIQNTVKVNGSVDVYNTVDVNIDEINGQRNVFYKKDDRYFLLPTYDPYN